MIEIVNELLSELNLDINDANTILINSLVTDAQIITLSAVNSTKKIEDYADNQIFQRAVKTLATQLFYDRTLANGTATGYRMMVTQLQAQEEIAEDDAQ
ncbi:MAG: head-tail connector protein [Liquorilactobacillus hordei]|uniref:head-tail connector protein n=1 Tax=Liquorilactobacillus hordei TaxID=468911 RepID=UPI0039E9AC27